MAVKFIRRAYKMPNGEVVYNPAAVITQNVSTDDLAQNIARISSLTKGDVLNVLSAFGDVLPMYLKLGRSVTLDGVATVSLQLKKVRGTKGVSDPRDVNLDNIDGVMIRFLPAVPLKNALRDVKIEEWDNKITKS